MEMNKPAKPALSAGGSGSGGAVGGSTAHRRLFDGLVVLDHLPETTPLESSGLLLSGSVGDGVDDCSGDELFLLPESVLGMDSASFREDVRSVAPSLLPVSSHSHSSGSHHHNVLNNSHHHGLSPHNSLDSTDSAKSLRLLEDSDGLRMARASEGCKTLWLCELPHTLVHTTEERPNFKWDFTTHTTEFYCTAVHVCCQVF